LDARQHPHREPEHAEAAAPCHLIARRVAARVPHGRMRLLPRLGQDLAGRERPELPLVALVLVLSPHLGELADHVLPDLPGAGEVAHPGKEAEDFVAACTPAGAELEPATRKV